MTGLAASHDAPVYFDAALFIIMSSGSTFTSRRKGN
jgi:hypothetical protein